jgi:hypothetical protein
MQPVLNGTIRQTVTVDAAAQPFAVANSRGVGAGNRGRECTCLYTRGSLLRRTLVNTQWLVYLLQHWQCYCTACTATVPAA